MKDSDWKILQSIFPTDPPPNVTWENPLSAFFLCSAEMTERRQEDCVSFLAIHSLPERHSRWFSHRRHTLYSYSFWRRVTVRVEEGQWKQELDNEVPSAAAHGHHICSHSSPVGLLGWRYAHWFDLGQPLPLQKRRNYWVGGLSPLTLTFYRPLLNEANPLSQVPVLYLSKVLAARNIDKPLIHRLLFLDRGEKARLIQSDATRICNVWLTWAPQTSN